MRAVTAFLIAALLLVGGVGVAGCSREEPREPVLSGELVGDGTYDAGAHRGKVTVVNFWASWCAPCRDETPELIAAYDAVKADGVAFLGVNVRDPNEDLARAFVDRYQVTYPSIRDPGSKLALAFEVPPANIPTTIVLGRDGKQAKVFREPLRRDELIAAIREVMGRG
jgi:thiol-disulfide isomerase/thioredoxin